MSAGEVASNLTISKSTLSSHFNILKKSGLIQEERNGVTIYYSLNMSVIEEVTAAVMDLFNVDKMDTGKEEKNEV